jgi:uracil phosphoribosyltransferase
MPENNVIIVNHPFIKDSLTHLRNENSKVSEFRRHSDLLCQFLFAESIKDLNFKKTRITTPTNAVVESPKLEDEIILLPILRAGLAMMHGALKLLPKSKVGLIGLERNEETKKVREYYFKMPKVTPKSVVIITDPMLATGGSLLYTLEKLQIFNLKEIRIVSVIAAPEGIKAIQAKFPNVKIFLGSLDKKLNDQKFIIPGLGDYGDRYFGTSE